MTATQTVPVNSVVEPSTLRDIAAGSGRIDLAAAIAAYTEITERLRDSHDKLLHEVQRLRDELASKNRELERRSRLAALGQMAAGMAHEIRNPLGGIALYASLLAGRLEADRESASIARKIATGVQRLNGLVGDILAFAGDIQPQKRPILLSAVLAEASELARCRLETAGTKLSCRYQDDVMFEGDPRLLVRAIANLLFNASDAAGEGQVVLEAEASSGQLQITVADSGAGIPTEIMDRIFNPFFTTKESGTGLGLAIVHRIVDSHGGRISVRNGGEGDPLGGAHFVLDLPIHAGV